MSASPPLSSSLRGLATALLPLVGLGACLASTEGDAPTPPDSEACPLGQVPSPLGGCMKVGIQGCAEAFVAEDGLCRPSIERCAAGTIPLFGEGCTAVGVALCNAAFVGEDGLCRASMAACPEGTMALPLEGCVPFDGDLGCGEGPWGNIPDGPNTLWVDPAAMPDGEGTKAKPLTTIAAAVAKAPKGSRIALAAGIYDEPIVLTKALEIVGRCASMVHVRGTSPLATPPASLVVDVAPGPTTPTLRGIRLGSSGGLGVLTQSDLVLDHVTILGASGYGVAALGPIEVELDHTLVRGTLPLGSSAHGRGVVAQQGATVTVRSSALVDNRDIALYASDEGSRFVIEGSLVEGTMPRGSTKKFGRGLEVNDRARASVARTVFVGNHDAALFANDPGTVLEVNESVLAQTAPEEATGEFGYGLQADGGAAIAMTASAVVQNHESGVAIAGAGTTLTVERSLVAESRPVALHPYGGSGLFATNQASARLVASTLDRNHATAIALEGGASLELEASLVTRTTSVGGLFGRGLNLDTDTVTRVRGSAIVGNTELGAVIRTGKELTITESLVDDTKPSGDGSYGMGIACSASTLLELTSSVVATSRTAGILVANRCAARIEQVLVDGVAPGSFHTYEGDTLTIRETYPGIGDGIVLNDDASVTLDELVVQRAARGAVVINVSQATLSHVRGSGERFGLVVQGSPSVIWDASTSVFVGGEQDVLSDGTLPVPGPPPMPEE
jgi:hypothetical protein